MKTLLPFLFVVVFSAYAYADIEGIEGLDETGVMNCYYAILCTERKPEVFKELIYESCDKLVENAWVWFKLYTKIENAANTPEFWGSYADIKCAYSDEEKQVIFNQWCAAMGEFWADECNTDPEGECCKRIEQTVEKFKQIMIKYIGNGVCSVNQAAGAAKQGGELAKAGAEEMKEKAGEFPKPEMPKMPSMG